MLKINVLLCALLFSLATGCGGDDGLCQKLQDCTDYLSTQILIDEKVSIMPDMKIPEFFELAAGSKVTVSIKWSMSQDNALEFGIFKNSAWNDYMSTGNINGAEIYKTINTNFVSDPIALDALDKERTQIRWVLGFFCKKATPAGMMGQACTPDVTLVAVSDIITKNSQNRK